MQQQNQYSNRVAAKAVLVKHGVDMTKVRITSTPNSVYLDGRLLKDGPGQFTAIKISAMLKELQQRVNNATISCDFDNWHVERTPGGFTVNKKRVKISYGGGGTYENIHISEDDLMKDVLGELEKGKKR